MPQPRLIHPVTLVILPINKGDTVYDGAAREPVKQVSRSEPVSVPAQVQWSKLSDPQPNRGGVQEKSSGYVIFRTIDLEIRSYWPQRGDRITSIGTKYTNQHLYLTGQEPAGHYDGDPKLLVFNFEDRQPTQRSG